MGRGLRAVVETCLACWRFVAHMRLHTDSLLPSDLAESAPTLTTTCHTGFPNSAEGKMKMPRKEIASEKPGWKGKKISLQLSAHMFKVAAAFVWPVTKKRLVRELQSVPLSNSFNCFKVNYWHQKGQSLSVTDAFKNPDIIHQLIHISNITFPGSWIGT